MTTSLRGLAAGTLTVDVLTEGVHSGDASGVVPSSFRIARKLLDRLEDSANGWILPSAFHAQIPPERVEQAGRAAAILGDIVFRKYPFAGGTRPMVDDGAEALLNRTWRPALSTIGADGFPPIANAGNVLRPSTSLKLSLRLPPTIDGHAATDGAEGACSKRIRRTARGYRLRRCRVRPAGTRRRRSRGSRKRSTARRARSTASRRRRWARAARYRSWRCSASSFPTRSS